MMTRIYFRRFTLKASIGVLPRERATKQNIVINLEFEPQRLVAATDKLTDTLDYREVKSAIETVISLRHYDLIENLAETVIEYLASQFAMPYIQLQIEKPEIFEDIEAVGVSMEYRAKLLEGKV